MTRPAKEQGDTPGQPANGWVLPGGVYRTIPEAFLNDPRVAGLRGLPRWLRAILWIRCKHGITYLPALAHQIAEQMGEDPQVVRETLAELAQAGLVEVEGSVVWVKGALEADPGMRPGNPKHVVGLASHLNGLPKIAIVRRFVEHYQLAYRLPDSLLNSLSVGYGKATDSLPNHNTYTNTKAEAEAPQPSASEPTETETEPRSSGAPARGLEDPRPARTTMSPAVQDLLRAVGVVPPTCPHPDADAIAKKRAGFHELAAEEATRRAIGNGGQPVAGEPAAGEEGKL